jgi:hypothetical protein
MRDTRQVRLAIAIGLSAAISAVAVEFYIRPTLTRKIR